MTLWWSVVIPVRARNIGLSLTALFVIAAAGCASAESPLGAQPDLASAPGGLSADQGVFDLSTPNGAADLASGAVDLAGLPPMVLPPYLVGYNEAWFGDHFSTDLTSDFSLSYVNKTFDGIVSAGGHVVRIWLFELAQGIVWNMSGPPPQTQGVASAFLQNLDLVLTAARVRGLWVYVTALDASEATSKAPAVYASYFKNMFNNVGGELDAYETKVLGPTLAVLNAHQENIYGFDLINEIEAATQVTSGVFANPYNDSRAFLKKMRDYVKTQSPWLKVTATAGYGNPANDISLGAFSGLGLDFYDIHEYSDSGTYSGATAACDRAQQDGVFIILGEYGQSTQAIDDTIQYNSTAVFLSNSKSLCFKAAIAWRYDYSALATSNWFNFVRADGSFRPAVSLVKMY